MAPVSEKPNVFFRLLIPAGGLFVITIFAVLAAGLSGDPQSPGNRLVNEYGGRAIAFEVALVLLLALAAMVADRIAILRGTNGPSPGSGDDPDSTASTS